MDDRVPRGAVSMEGKHQEGMERMVTDGMIADLSPLDWRKLLITFVSVSREPLGVMKCVGKKEGETTILTSIFVT